MTNRNHEMLVVLTALSFIEKHQMMEPLRFDAAKRSIMSLFIHSSDEEVTLRKLIELVAADRDLHQAFSEIVAISQRINSTADIVTKRVKYLKEYVSGVDLTVEERQAFFNQLLRFSHLFQDRVWRFGQDVERYLDLREVEARRKQEFAIAQGASDRLRRRLSGVVDDEADSEDAALKDEIIGNFDYEEARRQHEIAHRNYKNVEHDLNIVLIDLKAMCQMAMNPDMRDAAATDRASDMNYEDVFAAFTSSLKKYPRLAELKTFVIEYFSLFQRAYGVFQVDYENLSNAADAISENAPEYFDAKHKDAKVREQLDKVEKYESLVPFLEQAIHLVREKTPIEFSRFSHLVTDMISRYDSQWFEIAEELLVAKVSAESDITTRVDV